MNTKKILERFLAKSAKIQRYHIIYKEKGYSVAGDGFWLVRVKEEVEDALDSGDLNFSKYFSFFKTQKKDFLVTTELLTKAVKKNYSLTPNCTQCRGKGKMKHPDTDIMGECEYCHGTGMDSYGAVKISDHSVVNFARLYRLADILGGEFYLSSSQKSHREPVFFQKDGFEGFLMPVVVEKEDKEEVIDLRTVEAEEEEAAKE